MIKDSKLKDRMFFGIHFIILTGLFIVALILLTIIIINSLEPSNVVSYCNKADNVQYQENIDTKKVQMTEANIKSFLNLYVKLETYRMREKEYDKKLYRLLIDPKIPYIKAARKTMITPEEWDKAHLQADFKVEKITFKKINENIEVAGTGAYTFFPEPGFEAKDEVADVPIFFTATLIPHEMTERVPFGLLLYKFRMEFFTSRELRDKFINEMDLEGGKK